MLIRATTDFRHERVQFTAGIVYDVPERAGGYFIGNGWAQDAPDFAGPVVTPALDDLGIAPRPSQPEATLEVQDVSHTTDIPQAGG